MPKDHTYKVGNDVYNIPDEQVGDFLKDFPNASEVQSYTVGKDTFDIPIKEVPDFVHDNPNANPLKKKRRFATFFTSIARACYTFFTRCFYGF